MKLAKGKISTDVQLCTVQSPPFLKKIFDGQVLSREPRWHLVDFQQMSVVHHNEHLSDGLHPKPGFMRQAFDIYLNIFRQEQAHRLQYTAPRPHTEPAGS